MHKSMPDVFVLLTHILDLLDFSLCATADQAVRV